MFGKRFIFALLTVVLLMSSTSIDVATYQLGKRLFNEERYTEAAAEFKKIISRHQDSSYFQISLYYTGLSYQFAHQPQRALTYFKELYKRADSDSQKEMAFFGIGKSYFDQEKYANAIKIFKQYLQHYPSSKKIDAVLYMMGQSYDKKGDTDLARIWYNQLLQQYPRSPYARYARPQEQPVVEKIIKPVKSTEPVQTVKVNQKPAHQQDWADLEEVEEDMPQQVIQPVQQRQEVEEPEQVEAIQEVKKTPQKTLKKIVIQPQVEEEIVPVSGRVEGLLLSQKKKIEITVSKIENTEPVDMQPQVNIQPQQQSITPIQTLVQTNYQNVIQTNYHNFTNMTIMTQKVKVLDTEQLKIDNKRSQLELKQEEIERLRRLLEIKARLLELKEEAIKQKTILIQKTNAVVVTDEKK